MIHSMTGFGDASDQVDGLFHSVEIRSLNNRYFKASIRLPEEIQGLEAELESQLRRRLSRGSITLNVKLRMSGTLAAQEVDDDALLSYMDNLEALHARFSSDKAIQIDLTALLNMPGVLRPPADWDKMLDRSRPILARLIDTACDKLVDMRRREGEATAEDFRRQIAVMRDRMEIVKSRASLVVEEYHDRLRARVDELMARAELKLDENDLIREVAIFAERADIAEEANRMATHLEEFDRLVNDDKHRAIGRKLDFLTQEMLREANTMGSKSNDAIISRAVVDVKGAIDRIKEQAQNVE